MKPQSQKSDAQLALELKETIEQRRAIEKREDELKSYFKTKLASLGQDTANCGGILISLVDRTRTGLDTKAISAQMGSDWLKQFETQTRYTQIDVKAIGSSLVNKAA